MPFPLLKKDMNVIDIEQGSLESIFERKFTSLLGNFQNCKDKTDLMQKITRLIASREWKNILCAVPFVKPVLETADIYSTADAVNAEVAITDCEYLIADTGSIVVSSAQTSGRAWPICAPVHLVIAARQQILPGITEAIDNMLTKYSNRIPSCICFASGPSRTGDIEKTLVTGVHGPREVFVYLMTDNFDGISSN